MCRARRASGTRKSSASPPARLARHIRSEEHTSELQSPDQLVCRLLLEKKKLFYRYLAAIMFIDADHIFTGKIFTRIVSLVPSQTELLHALGLEKADVAIKKFCVHPRES